MQNTSPQNCSSHQSCWGCGLSWIHLISSGANSTCISGGNLGKPILRYKISKFYNTAKRKNVQVTNATHSNIFENTNPLHEYLFNEWKHQKLDSQHCFGTLIQNPFDLYYIFFFRSENKYYKWKGEFWEKFPKVSLEWWAEGLFTSPGWNARLLQGHP